MEKLKTIPKSRINRVRNFPTESGLPFEKYGKSENINDYTEREISEMILGIYKDSKNLLVDDYKTNYHNRIDNIRTFYIKDYYLITVEDVSGVKEHRITRFLYKIGFLNQGRKKFRGLYSIPNDYGTLLFGKYPKDLFHPIKRYINRLFFNDDYRISDFIFESELEIHTGH